MRASGVAANLDQRLEDGARDVVDGDGAGQRLGQVGLDAVDLVLVEQGWVCAHLDDIPREAGGRRGVRARGR